MGVLLLKAPLLLIAVFAHSYATRAFGFEIPFFRLLATLPIIFIGWSATHQRRTPRHNTSRVDFLSRRHRARTPAFGV